MPEAAAPHPFVTRPHRTLLVLTVPVLFSLVAEPLTGLVDTAFVARLGSSEAAALGVGTTLLASVFWAFNFLGIGTQTEIAGALGADDPERARATAGVALVLAAALGVVLALVTWPLLDPLARFMGAEGSVRSGTLAYLEVRLLGGPAVLLLLAGFGALRGVQDMASPLRIAVGVNLLNVLLDPLLIFGAGPLPGFGLAGAAWATTVSQWIGAGIVVARVLRRLGRPPHLPVATARRLLMAGRDLVVRTASLLLFLLLATRAATRAGAEAGAAHQGMRTIWIFTAFLLDAPGITAQSLVGYFVGAGDTAQARRAAGVACAWGAGIGTVLAAIGLLAGHGVAVLLVPTEAHVVFASAWWIAALAMPVNALAFATDGIHWGTGDYGFLRNVMLLATGLGVLGLAFVDPTAPGALVWIWVLTVAWIGVRTGFSLLRIWPGFGAAPLARQTQPVAPASS